MKRISLSNDKNLLTGGAPRWVHGVACLGALAATGILGLSIVGLAGAYAGAGLSIWQCNQYLNHDH